MNLDEAAAELEEEFGPNPQEVGAGDDDQDEWGDLIVQAGCLLGHDPDQLSDEDWSHLQDVALACQATTMAGWLAHLDAALRR